MSSLRRTIRTFRERPPLRTTLRTDLTLKVRMVRNQWDPMGFVWHRACAALGSYGSATNPGCLFSTRPRASSAPHAYRDTDRLSPSREAALCH